VTIAVETRGSGHLAGGDRPLDRLQFIGPRRQRRHVAAKDRPILAAAIAARATHFVTGDERDFGRWMTRGATLPLVVMTPRRFLTCTPAS
jgi:hypothetical protein